MTGDEDTALSVVCEVAVQWAEEYGWVAPDAARRVLLAVYALHPESLDEEARAWATAQRALNGDQP